MTRVCRTCGAPYEGDTERVFYGYCESCEQKRYFWEEGTAEVYGQHS